MTLSMLHLPLTLPHNTSNDVPNSQRLFSVALWSESAGRGLLTPPPASTGRVPCAKDTHAKPYISDHQEDGTQQQTDKPTNGLHEITLIMFQSIIGPNTNHSELSIYYQTIVIGGQ